MCGSSLRNKIRVFLIAVASSALLGAVQPPPRPDLSRPELASVERDCTKLLTETDILVKHLSKNSEDLKTLFSHYEEQSRNWREFLNGTAAKDANVHVLHQTGIKELNEEIWHITGTEEYLELFHDILHQYLKTNPALGSVLHNDYKNHFVSSHLDAPAFRKLVVEPVVEQLARKMDVVLPEWQWRDWISKNLYHGDGKSPAEAYFRAGLARAKYSQHPADISVSSWRAQAVARRERLVIMSRAAKLEWETVLAILHSYVGRGPQRDAVLKRWLRINHAESMFEDLSRYYDDLQIADFHPLPEPDGIPAASVEEFMAKRVADPVGSGKSDWTVERRTLFANVHNSRFIAVTDVQGLGGIARRFQDQWIARGADLAELQTVYAQSTAALEKFFAETYHRLKQILGHEAQIHVYRSGDDGIWFLPAMRGKQKGEVRELFRSLRETGSEHESLSLKLHYSSLIKINGDLVLSEGVADALMRARVSLFAGKKKYKSEQNKQRYKAAAESKRAK